MHTRTKKAKVYYHNLVTGEEIEAFEKGEGQTEEVTIIDAYFGKYPAPGLFNPGCPMGLNIDIAYRHGGFSGATYTNISNIDGLMTDLKASRTEELKGKKALAHLRGTKLFGLSALL